MARKKGFKSEEGYGSIKDLGGKSYEEISKEMNSRGYKMNHSTARHVYVHGLTKIAKEISKSQGVNITTKQAEKIAKSPNFALGLCNYIKKEML